MKKKIFLRLFLIMMLASGVVFFTYKYLDNINQTVTVFIAKERLDPETIILDKDVESVVIGYEEQVRFFGNAFKSKEDIIGKVVTKTIEKGDVFDDRSFIVGDSETHDVLDDSGKLNSDYFLDKDNRLAFISLPRTQSLGGDLKKGQLIDIIYTSQSDDTGGLYSSLLLQQIEVYKVIESSGKSSFDVQLVVKPEQGLILSLAKYSGNLDFMLASSSSDYVDIIPKLPQDLYIKLLEAGYMLVDQTGKQVDRLSNGETDSISELEKELAQAEKNLEAAFNAMNAAKVALEAEKDNSAKKDLYDLVIELEEAVRDLETSVDENKSILENMRGNDNE